MIDKNSKKKKNVSSIKTLNVDALSTALVFYTISLCNIYFRSMYRARIKE